MFEKSVRSQTDFLRFVIILCNVPYYVLVLCVYMLLCNSLYV